MRAPLFHVVGAGGIGCAVGYFLRAAGASVVFVDADEAKVECGRREGVRVDHHPPESADFVHFRDWQPPPDSTVLLCTKCYDNAAVLGHLAPSQPLVPIQNGFDPALERHGVRFEGIASFVSECLSGRPHTRITRNGRLHFGPREGRPTDKNMELVGWLALTASFVRVVDRILPYKCTKLMYNAAISPLAAAAGLDNGQLLWIPKARRLFFELLRENHAILKGAGIPLAKIGPFHPDTVSRILARPWVARSLAWAFYPSLRGSYCSMAGDLPRGRTEIDHYNGHLIELAGQRPCPWNRRVYELVKRMEIERIAPGLLVLDELNDPPVALKAAQ